MFDFAQLSNAIYYAAREALDAPTVIVKWSGGRQVVRVTYPGLSSREAGKRFDASCRYAAKAIGRSEPLTYAHSVLSSGGNTTFLI